MEFDFALIVLVAFAVTAVIQIIQVFQKQTTKAKKLHGISAVVHFLLAAGTYAFLMVPQEVVLRFAWVVVGVLCGTTLLWAFMFIRSKDGAEAQLHFIFLAINIVLVIGTYAFIVQPAL